MFFFPKSAKEDTSTSASSTGKPPPLRRHDTFGSVELFEAWAKDSFINQSTVDILVNTHEIDCLPAVLALKKEDFPHLNLPVGQRRLLEEAVEKLRQDYELVQPPTPKAKISLEMPKYKSMLEIGELAEEDSGNGGSIGDTQPEVPSRPRAQSGYSSQRKSGQRKSKVELGKDEKESRPEKEALLVTAQSKTTSQMSSKAGQRTKKDDTRSSKKSQEHSETKNYDDDSDDDEYTACACQRWLFVTIFMPVFLVLSILGFILVVLLMPFRLCCPKGGAYTNVLTFLFEVFLMAPCLACKWASGKRRSHGNSASGKPRYGGTDEVELGSK